MQTTGKHYLIERDFSLTNRYWNDDAKEWTTDPHAASFWTLYTDAIEAMGRAERATEAGVSVQRATRDLP